MRSSKREGQLWLTPSSREPRQTVMTIETIVGLPEGSRERQLRTYLRIWRRRRYSCEKETTRMVISLVVAAGVRCELQRDRRTKNYAQIQKPMG